MELVEAKSKLIALELEINRLLKEYQEETGCYLRASEEFTRIVGEESRLYLTLVSGFKGA